MVFLSRFGIEIYTRTGKKREKTNAVAGQLHRISPRCGRVTSRFDIPENRARVPFQIRAHGK